MKIKLEKEFITLAQFLKIADFVSSGGEAKYAVKELSIFVNGIAENRRGRKLYAGDELEVEGSKFQLICS